MIVISSKIYLSLLLVQFLYLCCLILEIKLCAEQEHSKYSDNWPIAGLKTNQLVYLLNLQVQLSWLHNGSWHLYLDGRWRHTGFSPSPPISILSTSYTGFLKVSCRLPRTKCNVPAYKERISEIINLSNGSMTQYLIIKGKQIQIPNLIHTWKKKPNKIATEQDGYFISIRQPPPYKFVR